MNYFFYIIFLFIKYNFKKNGKKRYFDLYKNILKNKPINICEIGIYTGERSEEMIKLSYLRSKQKINFVGFDLFEKINQKKIQEEFSKQPLNKSIIEKKLNKLSFLESIQLIKGDTKKTIPKTLEKYKDYFDFIFIDGGHSIETINSDFKNCIKLIKNNGTIILDDFYHNNPELSKIAGCNNLLNIIDKKKYNIKVLSKKDTHDSKYGLFSISLVTVNKRV